MAKAKKTHTPKTQPVDTMRVTVVLVVAIFSGVIGFVLGKGAALSALMLRGY